MLRVGGVGWGGRACRRAGGWASTRPSLGQPCHPPPNAPPRPPPPPPPHAPTWSGVNCWPTGCSSCASMACCCSAVSAGMRCAWWWWSGGASMPSWGADISCCGGGRAGGGAGGRWRATGRRVQQREGRGVPELAPAHPALPPLCARTPHTYTHKHTSHNHTPAAGRPADPQASCQPSLPAGQRPCPRH